MAKLTDNSEYKKAKIIRHNLLYAVAAPMVYQKWGFAYGLKHAGEMLDMTTEAKAVDVTKLSVEHLDALDFGRWTDEPEDKACGLRLIPVWLYPFLMPGQELACIDGTTTVVGDDYTDSDKPGYIDNDNRGGFIAYGVIPK